MISNAEPSDTQDQVPRVHGRDGGDCGRPESPQQTCATPLHPHTVDNLVVTSAGWGSIMVLTPGATEYFLIEEILC